MYGGDRPSAHSAPMTEPADVPTIISALDVSQPVSASIASRAPISHDAPTTPPAPRHRPTFMYHTILRWSDRCSSAGDSRRAQSWMRAEGLEPPRLAPPAPKADASTNSATPAPTRSYSGRSDPTTKPGWRNGRRGGLKSLCPYGRVGSSPTPGIYNRLALSRSPWPWRRRTPRRSGCPGCAARRAARAWPSARPAAGRRAAGGGGAPGRRLLLLVGLGLGLLVPAALLAAGDAAGNSGGGSGDNGGAAHHAKKWHRSSFRFRLRRRRALRVRARGRRR